MTERQIRDWTAPDGTRYRLVLEPPAPHAVRRGDLRCALTFVNNTDLKAKQVVRIVPAAFDLVSIAQDSLAKLLLEA